MKPFTETKSSHIIHSTKSSRFIKYKKSTHLHSKHETDTETLLSVCQSFYRYLIFEAMVHMCALLVVIGSLASL